MPKYHRIQIDDRAYKALIAESIGRDGVDIRDIASQILIDGVSKEALTYSGQFSVTFDEMPEIKAPAAAPGISEVAAPREAAGAMEVTRKIAEKAPPTGKTRGGPRKPVTDEQKAEVKTLEGTMSNRKIAEQVGISPSMVNNILSESKEIRD